VKKKLTFLVSALIVVLFLFPETSLAHPGRTASDGCHYCRTNCDYWGEVWNARHCHGGYTAPAPILPTSPQTPIPTNIPTPRPTSTPIPTKSPTPSPNSTLTPTPEVKGEETEATPTLSQTLSEDTQKAGDFIDNLLIGLTAVSGLVATGGIYMLYKGLKSKESGTEE